MVLNKSSLQPSKESLVKYFDVESKNTAGVKLMSKEEYPEEDVGTTDSSSSNNMPLSEDEIRVLADRYGAAVDDVINFLSSIEGKKNLKYDYAKEHYDKKRLEDELQKYKTIAAMNLSPDIARFGAPVSPPVHSKDGIDEDIKYQREIASAWAPFLLMRDQLSPPQTDDGIKESIKELTSLVSVLISMQHQPKDKDFVDDTKKLIELMKSFKDLMNESEEERKRKLEEETKRRAIEANREKVAKLLDVVQTWSPSSSPDSRDDVNKKFNNMFNKV